MIFKDKTYQMHTTDKIAPLSTISGCPYEDCICMGKFSLQIKKNFLFDSYDRLRAACKLLITCQSLLKTGRDILITVNRLLKTGHGSSITGHGSSITGRGSLKTGHSPLITGHGSLKTGRGSSITGRGSLKTGHGSPITGRESLKVGHGILATCHGLLMSAQQNAIFYKNINTCETRGYDPKNNLIS